ncbi:MAG: GntR family transcriptional regulator [Caldilineales bacterium]|nr:GntR family transcriptional regulator [Caldilineales bacterium]MDW8318034.1 GntR family transcriptional regulator [Anaerolineae bacterium]
MAQKNIALVEQVILEVLSAIEKGEFVRDEGLLPSETELAHRFGVSRATVREALGKLEVAGVVVRRQGIGTFLNQALSRQPARIHEWFDEAHGFVDVVRSFHQVAAHRFLDVAVVPAAELSQQLQCAPDAPVLAITKLIYSGSVPIIHSYNAMPLRLLPEEAWSRATELAISTDSIYKVLELHCNVRVHHQESEVSACLAGETLAPLLACQPGDPCLRVEEVAYSADLTPLFYGRNHFRSDIVTFRQIRRPLINIRPPQPFQPGH